MTEQSIGQWISDTGFVIGRYDPGNANPVQDGEIRKDEPAAKTRMTYDDYEKLYAGIKSETVKAKEKLKAAQAERHAEAVREVESETKKRLKTLRGKAQFGRQLGRAALTLYPKATIGGAAALAALGYLASPKGRDARRYRPASLHYDDYMGKSWDEEISKTKEETEQAFENARARREQQTIANTPGNASDVHVTKIESVGQQKARQTNARKTGAQASTARGTATRNKAAADAATAAEAAKKREERNARRRAQRAANKANAAAATTPAPEPPPPPHVPRYFPPPSPKPPRDPYPADIPGTTKKTLRHKAGEQRQKLAAHAAEVGREAFTPGETRVKTLTGMARGAAYLGTTAIPAGVVLGRKKAARVREKRAALSTAHARNTALQTELNSLKRAGSRNLKIAGAVGGAGLATAAAAPFIANRRQHRRENTWPAEYEKSFEEIEKLSLAPLKSAIKKPYKAVVGRYGSQAPGVEGKKGLDLFAHDWDRALDVAEPRIRRTYELGRDTRSAADEFRQAVHGKRKTKLTEPGTWGNMSFGQKAGLGALGVGGLIVGSKLAGPKPYPYQQQ